MIDVALGLVANDAIEPSQAHLRRAVSTAHYAVFHCLLRAASRRFVGDVADARAASSLVYRAFEHSRAWEICVGVARLSPKLREQLGIGSISNPMKDFCDTFIELQRRRPLADYHPFAGFERAEAYDLVFRAQLALALFQRLKPAELAAALALMFVRPRL